MEADDGDLLGLAAVPAQPLIVDDWGSKSSAQQDGPPAGDSDDNHQDLLEFNSPISTPHHASDVPEPVDLFAGFPEVGITDTIATETIQEEIVRDDTVVQQQDDLWGTFVAPTASSTAVVQQQPLDLFLGDTVSPQASTSSNATTTIDKSNNSHFDPFAVPSLTTTLSEPDPFVSMTTAIPPQPKSSSYKDTNGLDYDALHRPAAVTNTDGLLTQNNSFSQQQLQQQHQGAASPLEATMLVISQDAPMAAAVPASGSVGCQVETIGSPIVIETFNDSILIGEEQVTDQAPVTTGNDPTGRPVEISVDSVEDNSWNHGMTENGNATNLDHQVTTERTPSSLADGLTIVDEEHKSRQANGQESPDKGMSPPLELDMSRNNKEDNNEEREESTMSQDPMTVEAAVSVISLAPAVPESEDIPRENSKPESPALLESVEDVAAEKLFVLAAPTESNKVVPRISVDKAPKDDKRQEKVQPEDPDDVMTQSEPKECVAQPKSLQPSDSAHSEPMSKTNDDLQPEPISPTLVAVSPPAGGNGTSETVAPTTDAPPPAGISDVSNGVSAEPAEQSEAQNKYETPMESSNNELIATNTSLLERIEQLEKELQDSKLKVGQLQQHEANYQKDASLHVSLLDELQRNLQTQMNKRAEAENNVRRAVAAATATKEKFEKLKSDSQQKIKELEDQITNGLVVQSAMETELQAARQQSDESTKKEASMALRLNEILKENGETGNAVKYYETQVEKLTDDLETTKHILATTMGERDHLSEEVAQWKAYAESRSKQLEKSLDREKTLNKDRKRKMKEFVEAKSEEVRVAKADTLGLQTEIEQTNLTLKDLNQRYKQLHTQWVEAQTRNRELQRDITKMKMDSEKMSKVGGTLEAKLSRSAQESEDHKNKRLAAKNEVMAVLRQLEVERDVNHRLRERIKEIFTPKALSQQQSIRDLVDNLEGILQKLAVKLGRPIPPPTRNEGSMDALADESPGENLPSASDGAAAISEATMQRAINKLENETKRVSQYIQAATNTTGRLQSLVDTPSTRGCVGAFSSFLMSPHADGTSASSGY